VAHVPHPQPAFKGIAHRAPADGLPNADRVMEQGLILPCHHAMTESDAEFVCDVADAFVTR
jgi:CDP-6-deoxy-D-xylo-4-hexulose-3-dehydrase